jgi:hypothetical protein
MGVESPCQGSRCPTTRWVRPRWWLVAYRRKSLGLEFLDEDPAPEFLLGNVGGDSDSSSGGDLTELEDDEDDDVDDDDNEEFELDRAVLDILGGDSMTNDNLAPCGTRLELEVKPILNAFRRDEDVWATFWATIVWATVWATDAWTIEAIQPIAHVWAICAGCRQENGKRSEVARPRRVCLGDNERR